MNNKFVSRFLCLLIKIKKQSVYSALTLTIKNSPNCTTLELFTESFYEKIVDVQNIKIFSLIESFKDIA